jgi:hypothetical protein
MDAYTTIEELLEVVFSTWSMWSVYNNQWVKLVSHETEK